MNEKNPAEEDQPPLKKSPLRASGWVLGCLAAGTAVAGCYFLVQRYQEERVNKGIQSQNRHFGKGIADAVTWYYGDYNRLPKPTSAKPGEDCTTDTSGASGIIQILCGREGDADIMQNSRQINYLEAMPAAKARTTAGTEGSGKRVGGLIIEDGNMEAVDGWGHYYRIRMDSNYDGEMENPNSHEAGDGRAKLPNRVIVWSAGKDGKWETWDDNLKSWD